MKEKQKIRVKGQLRTYMQWPAILGILLMGMNVWIYRMDRKAGLVMSAFVLLYIVMVMILYVYTRTMLMKELVEFATQYGIVQNTLLKELAVPYAILLDDGKVIWMNNQFLKILGGKVKGDAYLSKYLPELNRSIFPQEENDIVHMDVYYNERQYQAELRKVSVEGFSETERLMEMPEEKEYFIAVYLQDVTELNQYIKANEEQRLVAGLIYIDNYDEVTQSMNDTNISNLSNYITNELSSWASQMGMFLKMIDEDHYFVLAYTKSLTQMEKEKFKLLDRIRERTSKQNFPVTLSIGLAYGGTDLAKLSRLSQSNLDLALGRGGDQVVVRGVDDSQARFYGGKTNPMEKRTRVRARMISQALQELMSQSDDIFVMGHARPDMDSIGACLGIRRIAKMNGKQCWLVLDTDNLHSDIQRLLDEIDNYPDIKESIISPEEALQKATKKSLLLMLDLSKPSISMSPELYDQLKNRVIIIDHHRRGEEFPENPMLVYIEPYASSTCELITEMFEYQSRYSDDPINKLEATAMLTGIIIDTKSFSLRTGTRTFDAASYLRSVGADSQMSQHFMKENVQSFLQRNHLIDRVEFVGNGNAVVVGENDRAYDPVTAAQAADSLLTVSGVQASYVVTHRSEDIIGISARSNGETNVQIIMEKMGGGGHLSNAATQIEDRDILDVRKQLLDLIAQTEENNTEETD